MVRKTLIVAMLGLGLTLAGCNTVRGVGKDIQSVANAGDEVV